MSDEHALMGTGLGSHAFCPPYPVEPNITLTRTPKPFADAGVAVIGARPCAARVTIVVTALTPLTCI